MSRGLSLSKEEVREIQSLQGTCCFEDGGVREKDYEASMEAESWPCW